MLIILNTLEYANNFEQAFRGTGIKGNLSEYPARFDVQACGPIHESNRALGGTFHQNSQE